MKGKALWKHSLHEKTAASVKAHFIVYCFCLGQTGCYCLVCNVHYNIVGLSLEKTQSKPNFYGQ